MNRLSGLLRLSPATRVATGLVSLLVMLLLLVDLFTGMFPDRLEQARRERAATASALSAQLMVGMRSGSVADLQAALVAALAQDPQLRTAALRKTDGEILALVGDHGNHWTLGANERSTLENTRLPIVAEGRPWGELQLTFAPALPNTLGGWLRDPLVQGIALVSVLGFIAFQLYLRRVLRYLDPNSAVPERVRTAFDTLTEGVLVLDPAGHIMLVNRAFRALHARATDAAIGSPAAQLQWLVQGLPSGSELPWRRAISDNRPVLGVPLQIEAADGGTRRELVLNCSPISDGAGRLRGCLASFSDVTELHERTERLRVALDELHASQREIELKNEELTRQATRDPLTGCLNRRAFMHETDQRFAESLKAATPLCIIMCDIDHFKSVNDQFGHASGDLVIQSAVKSLTRGLRVGDLLGRYGGEEFCILLPNTSMAQALEVGERLRAEVDANVGDALRQPGRPKVTMSFGIAEYSARAASPAVLIDLADQALYHSKQNGRNRVTAWAPADPAQRRSA